MELLEVILSIIQIDQMTRSAGDPDQDQQFLRIIPGISLGMSSSASNVSSNASRPLNGPSFCIVLLFLKTHQVMKSLPKPISRCAQRIDLTNYRGA
jgi:hypothetical protein